MQDRSELVETSPRSAFYVVVLMMLIGIVSMADRAILSLFLEPVRHEFSLTDTQMGLLVGFGFVICYTLFGLPFGALADRVSRKWLIFFGLVGWSLATSATALSSSLAALFVARAIVGIGEATLSPAAISTIGDSFSKERLGLATAIYYLGAALGGGAAMIFGGAVAAWAVGQHIVLPMIGQLDGWRLAIFLVGLSGLPLAALFALTVREAPRRGSVAPPPFSGVLSYLADHGQVFVAVFGSFALIVTVAYIPLLWGPALLQRAHGLSPGQAGLLLGYTLAPTSALGIFASGLMVDRLLRRGVVDAPLYLIRLSAMLQVPVFVVAYLAPNLAVALICLGIGNFLGSAASGLQGTSIQLLAPPTMRGRVIAIQLLAITLAGMGAGPLFVGLISDHLFAGALGPALAILSAVCAAGCTVILAVMRRKITQLVGSQ